ncbi:MAG TPA: methylaspartate mutase [Microlunatus sp.]|jgi:methylaspartate mutase epsilon subunit|nr:methylaspartate mutase [Microlunatus sp.]
MATRAFGDVIRAARTDGRLVVQPRMGFGDPRRMRQGLAAVKDASATTVGTITVDSYTRLAQHTEARAALDAGRALNGYPIVAHDRQTTRRLLQGIATDDFPVQVRHGSAHPQAIVRALGAAGLTATEGGPVSYCLPYGRTPVRTSVVNWVEACALLAALRRPQHEPHLETFGGCLLGQLCPPSLLVATSVLEALFFTQQDIRSISLSYAQQTNEQQDEEAVHALARLAAELLGDTDWHIVIYAYMGRFPRTPHGASLLVADAARLAVRTGAARLIVKTTVEAIRIPTVAENVAALEHAAGAAAQASRQPFPISDTETYREARALVEAVLELDDDVGRALVLALSRGRLDVPYCLHPDNAGRTESRLDADGWLRWSRTGAMPISPTQPTTRRISSSDLLASLSYVERRYDTSRLGPDPAPTTPIRRTS